MLDISNREFLREIFGAKINDAWITGFECSPYDANGYWAGGTFRNRSSVLLDKNNTFYCISLFNALDEVVHRRKSCFAATYVIMVDDVGSKIDKESADLIFPEPSYVIETSKGNYQYGYILAAPETRLYAVEQFQHGLIHLGFSKDSKDPGMFGVTRYCRLPQGTNNKNPNQLWHHVLTVWNPGNKYYLDELASYFGVELTEQPAGKQNYRMTEMVDDAVYQALLRDKAVKDAILGKPGAYDITCPWVKEHTLEKDNGTAYFSPGYTDGTYVYQKGGFKCHHGHCEEKTLHDVRLHFSQKYPDLMHKLLDIELFTPYHDTIVELNDLRVTSWLRQEPPVREWVFKDVMPLAKVCLLVAAGGVGKSYLTLQMALSVATGTPFCNLWLPEESGAVLCVYAEEEREELHRRLYAIQSDVFSNNLDESLIAKNLFITTSISAVRDNPNRLVSDKDNGQSTKNVDTLIDIGKRIKQSAGSLRMIILDPLVRFNSGNENDSIEATKFMEVAEHIARTLNCTILIPHHQNKISMSSTQQTQSAARGSTGFTDAARWQANLRMMHDAETGAFGIPEDNAPFYVQLAITKNNYGSPHPPVWLRREANGALAQCTLQKSVGRQANNAMILPKLMDKIEYEAERGRYYSQKNFVSEFSGEDGPIGVGSRRCAELLLQAIDSGLVLLETNGRMQILVTRNQKRIKEARDANTAIDDLLGTSQDIDQHDEPVMQYEDEPVRPKRHMREVPKPTTEMRKPGMRIIDTK